MTQDRLNIAIVIPGHLRFWPDCKENFLEKIYDTNHNIDVYVNTYSTMFRSDYEILNEKERKVILSDEEIKSMFEGINVISFSIDSNDTYPEFSQITKLQKCYKIFNDVKKTYDLVLRTRFDLMLEEKLDYKKIYQECLNNPKLIFIGKGGLDGLLNDMFAICLQRTFDVYMTRFKFSDFTNTEGMEHGSLKQIMIDHGIVYNTDTWILLKRPDEKIYKIGL